MESPLGVPACANDTNAMDFRSSIWEGAGVKKIQYISSLFAAALGGYMLSGLDTPGFTGREGGDEKPPARFAVERAAGIFR